MRDREGEEITLHDSFSVQTSGLILHCPICQINPSVLTRLESHLNIFCHSLSGSRESIKNLGHLTRFRVSYELRRRRPSVYLLYIFCLEGRSKQSKNKIELGFLFLLTDDGIGDASNFNSCENKNYDEQEYKNVLTAKNPCLV